MFNRQHSKKSLALNFSKLIMIKGKISDGNNKKFSFSMRNGEV